MEEFLEPAYGGRSLADVVPAVAVALGTPVPDWPSETPSLVLPEAPAYVVFLVDGLGADLLAAHAHAAPYLSSLLTDDATGTAGVPSTTATSLTSLGTGLTPGAHGVVGFTSRVPGTDRLLNALYWDKDVDPVAVAAAPDRLRSCSRPPGVQVTDVNKREFRGSGLTVAAQRGGDCVGADRVGERIAGAVAACGAPPVADLPLRRRPRLDRPPVRRRLVPVAPAARDRRRRGRAAARRAARRTPGWSWSPTTAWSTRPTRSAGSTSTTTRRSATAWCCSVARRGSGTSTARRGAVDGRPRRAGASSWPMRALVLTRDEAIARGWFGDGVARGAAAPRRRGRRGPATTGMFSSADFPYETPLIGLHGSLTPVEMRIPLLVT